MSNKKENEEDKNRSLTDADGNTYNFNEETRRINYKVDKYGFIYNSKGERTGNIHGYEYMEGYNYE